MAWDFSGILHKSYDQRQKDDLFSVPTRENVLSASPSEMQAAEVCMYVFLPFEEQQDWELTGTGSGFHNPMMSGGSSRPAMSLRQFGAAFPPSSAPQASSGTGKKLCLDSRMEEESKLILDTFNEAYRRVFAEIMTASSSLPALECKDEMPLRDFSMLMTPLSRILELELNLSLIQLIRQKNGVEMPVYFDKVDPAVPSEIRIKDKVYPINAYNRNRSDGGTGLCRMTLGDIYYLLKEYDSSMPGYIKCFASDFLQTLHSIKELRNCASHASICDEQSFIKIHRHFCNIVRNGWFKSFMDLKVELRGR